MQPIQNVVTDSSARCEWEPVAGVRGTRRFIEYARRFLSLASSEEEEAFRQRLARTLQDIDRVEIIFKEYKNLMARAYFSETMRQDFESWVTEKSIFIGSRFYNHDLLYHEHPHLKAHGEFQKVYEQFVRAITPSAYTPLEDRYTVLFTGQAGGGHTAPAHALSAHLQRVGKKVQLIDIDLLESSYMPKVDGFSLAELYKEVFQRQQNPALCSQLVRRMEHKQPITSKRYLGAAKEMIARFQTAHIFSVAHHRRELGYLSYQLGIPMTIVHTDYVFQKRLMPLIEEQMQRGATRLIHFTAPTEQFVFFKDLLEDLDVDERRVPSVLHQFQRLDLPVRDAFTSPSEGEIIAIRTKLNIAKDALTCKIAMGQSGITALIQSLVEKFSKEVDATTPKVHLFVICGQNEELKKALQQSSVLREQIRKHGTRLTVDIRGFLHEEEMAEIDKVSEVWITKPGGSTCAELISTGKTMLYVLQSDHPWEAANAKYLEKLKVAKKLSTKRSIIQQVQEKIAENKNKNHAQVQRAHWKDQVNKIISK